MVTFLILLLPQSETYKQLSWGFKLSPRGQYIFALEPMPSLNPADDPASVVT
jgi:hypothetical protein